MAERYATIIQDEEGREVISNISLFEGKPDQPRSAAKLVKIGDGPKIGMVKGGKGEEAEGWGFPIPVAEEPTATRKAKAKKAGTKKEEAETPAPGEQADAGDKQD